MPPVNTRIPRSNPEPCIPPAGWATLGWAEPVDAKERPLTEPILLAVEGGLAHITLNRPERLNAFDAALAHGWAEATREATSRDDVTAVLIDATGPAFCAGGDVVAMATQTATGADLESLAHVINSGISALVTSAVPVVAAAHGTTAGGGLGILLSSDYAIVGRDSRIGCRYAAVGLTPDLSVTALLARGVGERRALQLVLSDRLLSAREALDWGLVAEVVDVEDERADSSTLALAVRRRAEEVARGLAAGPAFALGQAKRLIRSRPERSFDEQLAEEARTIGVAFDTADARERIRAFAARSTGGGRA